MERIIKIITESGTGYYEGVDADTLINGLNLEVNPSYLGEDVPNFVDEVKRKVENFKPKQKE